MTPPAVTILRERSGSAPDLILRAPRAFLRHSDSSGWSLPLSRMSSPWRIAVLVAALVAPPLAAQQLPPGAPPTTDQADGSSRRAPISSRSCGERSRTAASRPIRFAPGCARPATPKTCSTVPESRAEPTRPARLRRARCRRTTCSTPSPHSASSIGRHVRAPDLLRKRAARRGVARGSSRYAHDCATRSGPLRTDSTRLADASSIRSAASSPFPCGASAAASARSRARHGTDDLRAQRVRRGDDAVRSQPRRSRRRELSARSGRSPRAHHHRRRRARVHARRDAGRVHRHSRRRRDAGGESHARAAQDQLYAQARHAYYSGLRRGAGATTHFSLNVARLHTQSGLRARRRRAAGELSNLERGHGADRAVRRGRTDENGGMRRVEIRRGGKLVDTLDLYDYLLHADGSHDCDFSRATSCSFRCRARVRLYGEVVRPGTYELRRGESLADSLRPPADSPPRRRASAFRSRAFFRRANATRPIGRVSSST